MAVRIVSTATTVTVASQIRVALARSFFFYLLPFGEFPVCFSRNGGARCNYYKLIQALGDFVQMMLESQPHLEIGNKSFVNVLLVYY